MRLLAAAAIVPFETPPLAKCLLAGFQNGLRIDVIVVIVLRPGGRLQAGEEVSGRKLLGVADDDDLLSAEHAAKSVLGTHLRCFVDHKEVELQVPRRHELGERERKLMKQGFNVWIARPALARSCRTGVKRLTLENSLPSSLISVQVFLGPSCAPTGGVAWSNLARTAARSVTILARSRSANARRRASSKAPLFAASPSAWRAAAARRSAALFKRYCGLP